MPQGIKHRTYKKETTRYRFSRPTIKPEDEDLLRRGLQSNLKMRTCSGVVLTTYHKHLRAMWRQDTLQVSQIQLIDMYVGVICNFNVHLNYNGCKLIHTARSRPLFFSITQI